MKIIKNLNFFKLEKSKQLWKGIAYGLLGAILNSLQIAFIKKLGNNNVEVWETAFLKAVITIILAFPLVIRNREDIKETIGKNEIILILVRATIGTFTLAAVYYSIQHMPIGNSTALRTCSTVLTTFFAYIALKEPCGLFEVSMSFITVIGSIYIIQPPFLFGNKSWANINLYANLTAIGSAFGTAFTNVSLRKLKKVHYSVTMLAFGIIATIFSAPMTSLTNTWTFPLTYEVWLYIIGTAVLSFISQILFTISCQIEEASTSSVLRSSTVLFVYILQVFMLNENLEGFSIIGSSMIFLTTIGFGLKKIYVFKNDDIHSDEDNEAQLMIITPIQYGTDKETFIKTTNRI